MLNIQNLDWLRKVTVEGHPEFGAKLYSALLSVQNAHNNVEQQPNSDSDSEPAAPPAINGLKVTAQNGHFSWEITDTNQIYRGAHYFLEHADNPHFTNPIQIQAGPARNGSVFLGNATRYWRAYSSYGTSPASSPIYHGGAQPIAVTGGGSVGAPATTVNQGAGTGAPSVGLVGYGPVQYRSTTGVAPPRKVSK